MSASPKRPRRIEPTPIDSGAVENLRYIRSTIEAAIPSRASPAKAASRWASPRSPRSASNRSRNSHRIGSALGRRRDRRLRIGAVVHGAEGARPGLELAACRRAAVLHDAGARLPRRRHPHRGARRQRRPRAHHGHVAAALRHRPRGVRPVRDPAVFTAGLAFMALGTATLWLPPGSVHIVLALGFGGIHLVLGDDDREAHGG